MLSASWRARGRAGRGRAARAGVCTWLNGAFWMAIVATRPDGLVIVSNLTEGAKQQLESVQTAIEPDLLYPLLRGREVSRWRVAPQDYILLTHEPGMGLKAIPEEWMAVELPKTYAYLKRFEEPLRRRSGYHHYFHEGDPFYSLFNIGDYTFSTDKVVWKEQGNRLTAAVASSDSRPIVPDHKLMMVSAVDEQSAHYLCAALNSSPAQFIVLSYAVNIQMDTHVLENIRIPSFDQTNIVHRNLAQLSREAHESTASKDTKRLVEIESSIDDLVAQLWGLTAEELKEIKESLRELD